MHAVSRIKGSPQEQEEISILQPMEMISLYLHNYKGKTYLTCNDRCSRFHWCFRIQYQSLSAAAAATRNASRSGKSDRNLFLADVLLYSMCGTGLGDILTT